MNLNFTYIGRLKLKLKLVFVYSVFGTLYNTNLKHYTTRTLFNKVSSKVIKVNRYNALKLVVKFESILTHINTILTYKCEIGSKPVINDINNTILTEFKIMIDKINDIRSEHNLSPIIGGDDEFDFEL